ncbi:unnamed protein product [Cuscuta campestris]|uniref:Uncharacterized protein n=1 Tax=Cuscuta campestris TaxID=132261 RepID=A0A484K5R4_9ASTE|nr:unnamed protein product [Cuscuta campestris]
MEHVTYYFEKLYGARASTECERVKALLDSLVVDYEKRGSLSWRLSQFEGTCKDNALECSSILVDEDVQGKITEEDGDAESDEDDI